MEKEITQQITTVVMKNAVNALIISQITMMSVPAGRMIITIGVPQWHKTFSNSPESPPSAAFGDEVLHIMKILNLYAGIGGNRKLWTGDIEVTAVEFNPDIAAVYSDMYPNDKVIVGDAHQYLLENFKKFDFIWTSPPCQSHSKARQASVYGGATEAIYPDTKLYQEIILLKNNFKGQFLVENVQPYYEPLICPSMQFGRHLFWSNFKCDYEDFSSNIVIEDAHIAILQEYLNIDLSKYNLPNKKQILRNCVNPELGLHIFNQAFDIVSNRMIQKTLF